MKKIVKRMTIIITFFLQINIVYNQNLQEKSIDDFNREAFSLKKDKQEKSKLKEENWIQLDQPITKITSKLKSNDDEERLKAVVLLGKVKDTKQIPNLEQTLLKDNSAEIRAECAKALKYLYSFSSISVLEESLNDNDREVQMQAAISLAYLGEKEKSFEKLKGIHNTGNRREKLACNLAMRDIGNQDAIEFLIKTTNDQNPYVAVDASIILAQLEYYEKAFPILKKILNTNPNNSIKRAAMRGLAYIGDEKSILLIKNMVNYPDELTSKRAQSLLKSFK